MAEDKIEQVVAALVAIEQRIDGTALALQYSPEAIVVVPCFINYFLRGQDQREEASTIKSVYTFGTELYVARGFYQIAESTARPFVIKYADAIWKDPTLGGTVDTVLALRHAFQVLVYAQQMFMGIRYEVDVKMRRAVAI